MSKKFIDGAVIITGGAGFVASHLAERLLNEEKHNISRIYLMDNLIRTNSLRNIQHLLDNRKVEFVYADVSTFEFENFDPFSISHVFHLAATRINRCNDKPLEGHNYIATGGAKLIDWASRYHNIKLFFASSASVYQRPKEFPIKEDAICHPHTVYGAGKLYTELLLKSYSELFNLSYVINRFFSIYGPRMDNAGPYTEAIFNFLNQIKKQKTDIFVYGNPDEKIIDLVYVDDVVDAILLTTEKADNEIFNVSTETGITLTQLIDIIENVTNVKLNRIILPEERKDIELKRVGDVSKLKSLGWEPKVSVEEGIKKTWEWISETK